MKKLFSILTIVALVFSNATFAHAAASEIVTITITISHSAGIEVAGSANLAINPGDTSAGGAITVKNDGTGLDETITLANVTTLPDGWTLQFQFTDVNTAPAVDDPNWKDPGQISELIPYDITKYLWIKLGAPSVTGLTTLDISLTINAA